MKFIADFLGIIMPPFLSRVGFIGQLKSRPITTFSLESKFLVCSSVHTFFRNLMSSSLFGA